MGQFDFTTGQTPNRQINGTLTVGSDGAGHDVTLYGGTASNSLTWDASENVVNILSTMKAADNVLDITVTDATGLSSGYGRGAYISYTLSGATSGGYAINGLGIDMFVSEACPTVSALEIYTDTIANKTVGNLYPLSIYCADIGTAVSNFMALDIGINSTNLASSRHTGIRIRNHAGTAKSAILIEEAFTDTILRHSPSGVDLKLITLDNSSGAIFYWDDSEGLFRFGNGVYADTLKLGGKLTGGANEIEGSAFDINGGTMSGITLDGAITGGNQNLNNIGHIGLGNQAALATSGVYYLETQVMASASKYGVELVIEGYKTSAAFGAALVGGSFLVAVEGSNTQNWTNPAAGLRGINTLVRTEAGATGTITKIASMFADAEISGASTAATVTNYYGLYIEAESLVGNSKLTNDYGIYVADQAGGATLNYAIYTAGGAIYHAGAMTLGSTLKLGGALDADSNLINNVTDPSGAQDAATKNYVDDADSALDYGLSFEGVITTYTDSTHFKVSTLAGKGTGFFKPVTGAPYEIYVVEADGAAPEGERRTVVAYTTADGTFQHAAFSANLAVGDIVLIMHPILFDAYNMRGGVESLESIDSELDAELDTARGTYTKTMTSGEDDLYGEGSDTEFVLQEFRVDLHNMAVGDTICFRVYTTEDGTERKISEDIANTFIDVQDPARVEIVGSSNMVWGREDISVTAEQTAGTNREIVCYWRDSKRGS